MYSYQKWLNSYIRKGGWHSRSASLREMWQVGEQLLQKGYQCDEAAEVCARMFRLKG